MTSPEPCIPWIPSRLCEEEFCGPPLVASSSSLLPQQPWPNLLQSPLGPGLTGTYRERSPGQVGSILTAASSKKTDSSLTDFSLQFNSPQDTIRYYGLLCDVTFSRIYDRLRALQGILPYLSQSHSPGGRCRYARSNEMGSEELRELSMVIAELEGAPGCVTQLSFHLICREMPWP